MGEWGVGQPQCPVTFCSQFQLQNVAWMGPAAEAFP